MSLSLVTEQTKRVSLYRVTVNDWEWNRPDTVYFRSKLEALAYASRFPASDPVIYAGRYTLHSAAEKLLYSFPETFPFHYGDYLDGCAGANQRRAVELYIINHSL